MHCTDDNHNKGHTYRAHVADMVKFAQVIVGVDSDIGVTGLLLETMIISIIYTCIIVITGAFTAATPQYVNVYHQFHQFSISVFASRSKFC